MRRRVIFVVSAAAGAALSLASCRPSFADPPTCTVVGGEIGCIVPPIVLTGEPPVPVDPNDSVRVVDREPVPGAFPPAPPVADPNQRVGWAP